MIDRRKLQPKPVHDLLAIQRVAASGRVSWQDSVNDDLVKWEYSTDEVLECLQALKPEHCSGNKDYNDGNGVFDVYKIRWRHYVPSQDKIYNEWLYIKIKLSRSGRAAFMLSFHPY